jgi:hypothetical protein
LSDGNAVATWDDDSESGNDATQAANGNRPTYKTGIQNSLPVVRFDGNSDFLELSDPVLSLSSECSIFAVAAMANVAAGWATLIGHGPASATDYAQIGTQGNGYQSWRRKNGASGPHVFGNVDLSDGEFRVWSAIGKSNGSISRLGINGDSYGASADTASFVGARSLIGVSIYAGALEQYWVGDVGEILMASSELSESNRQKTEGYLAHKWALTAGLPNDHPYKTKPPYK